MIMIGGMVVGLFFDFYRILRWRLGFNRILTFIGDIGFSLIALAIIFFFAQTANFLEFRFYLFIGSLLGLFVYLKLISPLSKKLFNLIFNIIAGVKNAIIYTITFIIKTIVRVIILLMSVPYGILQWFSVLLFRMGEAAGKSGINRIKAKKDKIPKE